MAWIIGHGSKVDKLINRINCNGRNSLFIINHSRVEIVCVQRNNAQFIRTVVELSIFAITSRILRILMEHIDIKNSLDSKLQIFSMCSVRILNTLEVIAKKRAVQKSQNAQPWLNPSSLDLGGILFPSAHSIKFNWAAVSETKNCPLSQAKWGNSKCRAPK